MSSTLVSESTSPGVELSIIPLTPITPITLTQAQVVDDDASEKAAAEEVRPQAGPLPSKRGEIGYMEGSFQRDEEGGGSSSVVENMPARHPADREPSGPTASTSGSSSDSNTQDGQATARPSSPSGSAGSMRSTGKHSFISFLRPHKIPTYFGLRATTLIIFFAQICLLGGTIAGWVLAAEHISTSSSNSSSSSDDNSNDNNNNTNIFAGSAPIVFLHVAFAIVTLLELIFIERTIFRLRAERYCYLHPGEVLPTSFRRTERSVPIGIAPWHRPPLPTYAAALAQSGVGTGDVEDNIIAMAPPPAYGNTRGSTLLLANVINDTMRAHGRRESLSTVPESRPMSYMSQDPEWEERVNADRAARLEETLARLEAPERARTH